MAARGDNFKGQRPANAGRKAGTANKSVQVMQEILSSQAILDKIASGELAGPLSKMFYIMNDEDVEKKTQLEAAKALAKYTNRAQPTLTETTIVTTDNQFQIQFVPANKND